MIDTFILLIAIKYLTSNIPLSMLKYLHSKVTNNLMPDLTLVIDIDFDIGIKKEVLKKKRRN